MAGLYIHIPFCRSKCAYCAFFSRVPRAGTLERMTGALLGEIRMRRDELCGISTIYIGGGTPSLLPPSLWRDFVAGVKSVLRTPRISEFTIEVNPDDVDEARVEAWLGSGVTRISMGVQSFSDQLLRSLGRRHDAASARRAYSLIAQVSNVSLDLIFGHYGQSLAAWNADIDAFLELRPQHLSAYSLTVEENTRLASLISKGAMQEAPEEDHAAMYELLCRRMRAAGYNHYEISSFALPGFRSRHNSSYWHGVRYVGIGPSAAGYDGRRTRRTNIASAEQYMKRIERGELPEFEEETLTDEELFEEFVMTRLRTSGGIPLDQLERRFGTDERSRVERRSRPFISSGALRMSGSRLRLSPSGAFLADAIIVDLIT